MARDPRLDAAGGSAARALIAALLLLFASGPTLAQATSSVTTSQVKRLYAANQWREIVRLVPESSVEPASLELYRGLALARLGDYSAAKRTFQAGLAGHPRDARFLTELAGIAYAEKHFSNAKIDLRRALAITPRDAYSNNFLASIYYLEGNLEAALKYWNRVGKPKLSDLQYDPIPTLDPLILDRAFKFSPGGIWTRDRFLTTKAELDSLDLFPHSYYDLQAQPDGSFRLVWRNTERSRWDKLGLINVLPMLRGLPYLSVYPEFYNLNGKGLNWRSFFRWDDQKRRLSSEIAGPILVNPRMRFRVYFGGRNENWDIGRTLLPTSQSPAGFNMERAAVGAEYRSIVGGRSIWDLGVEYSYRRFRTLVGIPQWASPFFTDGSGLMLRLGGQRFLTRFPERRFTLNSSASAELGRFYAKPLGNYGRVQGSLIANWFPKASGTDYQTRSELRAGRTFGQVPFDDLFMLGFDRDNDLWMRGHDGLRNGRKGNAPLGRNFILSNSDFDKIVYRYPLFSVKMGPFLDTGDVYDPSAFFGSTKWLTDTGVQFKIGLLGSFQVVLGYGKDLRSGNNTFFSTVSRPTRP